MQQLQTEFKTLFNFINEEFTKHKYDTERKFSDIVEKIEKNFSIAKIDREGVLKEIRVWEKTIFIIEKKIENLYTLIERINKKGDVCHKRES